jgi:hypothetical protein
MISYGLAYLVDNRYNYLSVYYGLTAYFAYFEIFALLVGFWALSHLLVNQGSQRAVWPAIILAIGAANLGNLIITWATPINTGILGSSQTLPTDIALTLMPSSLLLIFGGILGFIAARNPA